MDYKLSDIAEIIEAQTPREPIGTVSELLTDSRSLTFPEQTLFFALTTPQNDGHKYIPDLYEKGVRNFVAAEVPEQLRDKADANFLIVSDVARALQRLAAYHRRRFSIPVVGLTGSRGKTTVKEWLDQLLREDHEIVRSPRSYNSQIGVPLSVWDLAPDTTLGIFETGISQPGEMVRLRDIVLPNIAVVTNIGHEHDAAFRSRETKCREKATLSIGADCTIYDADDRDLARVMGEIHQRPGSLLGHSRQDMNAPLYVEAFAGEHKQTALFYTYRPDKIKNEIKGRVIIPFTDNSDIDNAITCLAVLLRLGMDTETIAKRMGALTPVGTRLEVLEGVNECLVIHDSYPSDLQSLLQALDFMARRQRGQRQLTVILSDLAHDAGDPARLYSGLARLLRHKGITRVIGIGPEMMRHQRYFGADALFYETTEEFLDQASGGDFHREMVLIKGAPEFGFLRVAEMLEARQHETVMEINLDALRDNFNAFRSRLNRETGIVCMLKAYGYGAGSVELARTLQAQGAAYLAVAVHDEGVELRQAGITMPIIVLNPKVENFKSLFSYNLEPEIYSFDFLQRLIREAEKCGVTDYPIHIKIDSGMHRLGFREHELSRLKAMLMGQEQVLPKSIFSHLCCAEDPSEDEYTQGQFDYFDRCCDELQQAFPHHILRHILNSSGISRFPEHQYDMVRLGIGLYGVKTLHDGSQDELRPVSSLRAPVISIKTWPAGTTIGYNRRGRLDRETVVATIPIGYADGLNRKLGYGHASVMLRSHRCPIIGTICMDACMIDVTDAPGGCKVGDRVEIFGEEIPVEEIANTLGTIPYEVLTSISTRVKRLYYRE